MLKKLKNILKKANLPVNEIFNAAFKGGKIEDLSSIEEILILSDISIKTTEKIISQLKKHIKEHIITQKEEMIKVLYNIIYDIIPEPIYPDINNKPLIMLVSGINGSGKTTSIAKLTYFYKQKNIEKILLVAADTFRAAADKQLDIWSKYTKADIFLPNTEKEPAAVSFAACKRAIEERYDIVIIDTAGRMHTNYNLMNEIKKIYNVLNEHFPNENIFSFFVIDATNGKSTLSQAQTFNKNIKLDSIFLTKLDGTAKGGTIITIADELNLPISFVGIGERSEDIIPFNKKDFIDSILF